jgi:altronate hydrolase
MRGWVRADGRKGIRNTVVVAYLVECAHHVAREIAIPFREHDVHIIGFPGCFPNGYAERMLDRLCTHPNVGAVLLVSLGCESFNKYRLAHAVAESGRPVHTIVIQAAGGTRSSIAEGRAFVAAQRAALDAVPTVPMDISNWSSAPSAAARTAPPASPATRPPAAPSTCWSPTAPPASSRRRAN